MPFNLSVYVLPKSSKTEVVGKYGDAIKIKLKSPPVDGAANEELIRFLSKALEIPRRNIEIIKGHTNKRKTVSIAGCDEKTVRARLIAPMHI